MRPTFSDSPRRIDIGSREGEAPPRGEPLGTLGQTFVHAGCMRRRALFRGWPAQNRVWDRFDMPENRLWSGHIGDMPV